MEKKSKLKVAFLNFTQGAVDRGAETFVRELSERLKKSHSVEIISDNRTLPPRWPVLWRLFIDPQGLLIAWFTLKALPRILKERFDIVIPVNGGWQPAFIRIVTWLYGGKMVISGQSGKGWDDRNNLWCFPDIFVALSSRLYEWATRANPFVKVVYIPNGADTRTFKPEGHAKKFNLERPVILCVGALTEEKRIELVINTVSKLKQGSLLVVGDGPLKNKISKMGKDLLGKRFLLTKARYEEMPEIYRSADIFTLPSPWYRSFEIVLVEAMASGLPVVANGDPIRREIVGDAGILVDPTYTDEYAKALELALKTKWSDKPRRQAEKFDWDIIAEKYDTLFRKLVLSE